MPDADREKIGSCRQSLKFLAESVQSRASHWRALPGAIHTAVSFARAVADGDGSGEKTREVAREIIKTLEGYESYVELPFEQLNPLVADAQKLLALARSLGEANTVTLWDILHSTLEQHMVAAAAGVQTIRGRFDEITEELRGLPDNRIRPLVGKLEDALSLCDPQVITLTNLDKLGTVLLEIRDAMPAVAPTTVRLNLELLNTRRFRIIVVEDNELWQSFVLRAVDAVRESLGSAVSLETTCVNNVDDALGVLMPEAKGVLSHPENKDGLTQLIAVVDMGLPADPGEAEAIAAGRAAPNRENGHRLLREIRAYKVNVPAIVLTTPSHLLQDQLRACDLGVEDDKYILKDVDKQERLAGAIIHLINRAQSHRIRLSLTPKYEASIDGVPILLTEMPFRTFYALCLLSRRNRNTYYTLRQILDQLDETFRDEYDYKHPPETAVERALVLARQRSGHWWDTTRYEPIRVANVIRLWAARKVEAGGDLAKALESFRRDFMTYRDAVALLKAYRAAHSDKAAREDGAAGTLEHADSLYLDFEEAFGGLEAEERSDYDLHNIEDHIHQIRQAIHGAFNAVHKFVEPRLEILIRRLVDDEYGFRVYGNIVFADAVGDLYDGDEEYDPASRRSGAGGRDRDRAGARDERYIVLVVEDDAVYRASIETLMRAQGLKVLLATNTRDAVETAQNGSPPDILCLDMHIPATREEFEQGSHTAGAYNGPKALEAIRRFLPEIKVVIPTTLYNQDELREKAAELGVPLNNFVPKGGSIDGAQWEGHLFLTTSRLIEEIRDKSVLPPLPPWRCPVVRVLKGSDITQGRLNLSVNGRQSKTQKGKYGRLLGILLESGGDEVSLKDLKRADPSGVTAEEVKQFKKYLRAKIRKEWLGLSREAPERPELEILEGTDRSLVLHAYVEQE